MIGLFMVSLSGFIAKGLMDMVSDTAPEIPAIAIGGGPGGELGCDLERIVGALEDIISPESTIVLFDSMISYLAVRQAIADLRCNGVRNITTVPAAFIEGALTAAREISKGIPIEDVIEVLEKLKLDKA